MSLNQLVEVSKWREFGPKTSPKSLWLLFEKYLTYQTRRYTLRKSCAEEGHCISWSLDCGGFPTAFLEFFVSSFKSLSRYRRHFMRSLRFNCLVEALIFPRLTKASNENIASRPKMSELILSASKLHE